jgi:hypothetical protein
VSRRLHFSPGQRGWTPAVSRGSDTSRGECSSQRKGGVPSQVDWAPGLHRNPAVGLALDGRGESYAGSCGGRRSLGAAAATRGASRLRGCQRVSALPTGADRERAIDAGEVHLDGLELRKRVWASCRLLRPPAAIVAMRRSRGVRASAPVKTDLRGFAPAARSSFAARSATGRGPPRWASSSPWRSGSRACARELARRSGAEVNQWPRRLVSPGCSRRRR